MLWWQRQHTVEGSLRRDERTPDTPPAKHRIQPREAARYFEVELRQHWYGGLYKAIFSIVFRRDEYFVNILLSIDILLEVNKVQFAVVGDASYIVTDMRRTAIVGRRCSPDESIRQLIKAFTDDSPTLFHCCAAHPCILVAYFNAPISQFCIAFFQHAQI